MKQIQPVVFPLNIGTATFLNCVGNDNFSTSVIISYQLLSETNQQLQFSNLTMDGIDYDQYNICNDGNAYIYNWTAQKLNVTLI